MTYLQRAEFLLRRRLSAGMKPPLSTQSLKSTVCQRSRQALSHHDRKKHPFHQKDGAIIDGWSYPHLVAFLRFKTVFPSNHWRSEPKPNGRMVSHACVIRGRIPGSRQPDASCLTMRHDQDTRGGALEPQKKTGEARRSGPRPLFESCQICRFGTVMVPDTILVPLATAVLAVVGATIGVRRARVLVHAATIARVRGLVARRAAATRIACR